MKKSLMVLSLAASVLAAQAQNAPSGQPSAAQGAAPAQQAQQPPVQQKKVIQDPGEYNAYMAAVNTSDPAQRVQMIESYLQTYPNSVMKEDMLDLQLKTYQQLNNLPQVKSTAQRLLQLNPNHILALAMLSALDRTQAQQGGPDAAAALQEAGQFGARGLEVMKSSPRPEGYTDQQWNTVRGIFLGSVGHAAVQAKDYPTAQQNLKEAVAIGPNDVSNIFLLALSYLQAKPPVVDGLFWMARAASLTQNPQLLSYAKNQYVRYHGGEQGFDELMATAKSSETIPAGFTVAPAPSAADQAHDMLKKGPADALSFAEWQFILANGSKEDAEQIWSAIKGKAVRMVAVSVQGSTREALKLAGSVDDIEAKKADITLVLAEPLSAARLPNVGAELTIQGVPSDYKVEGDSFNMTLTGGEVIKGLPEGSTTKPGAHKPAAGARKK